MAALPKDSYLDFVYTNESSHMDSLWREDRRGSEGAWKDLDGLYTPPFMAKLFTVHPDYKAISFEGCVITIFSSRLKSIAGEAAKSMSDEVFSLYAPNLSDFVLDSVPMLKPDGLTYVVTPEEMFMGLLQIIKACHPEDSKSVTESFIAFYQTLERLITAAVRGRRYSVVTGLPKLDAWLAEAQTCLEEFVLPNGIGDELYHRDLIRMQIFMRYAHSDTVLGGEYISATQKMPNDAILAFNGEELVTVSSRREAVDLYLAVELDVAKRELADHERGIEASRKPKKLSLLGRINRWIGLA